MSRHNVTVTKRAAIYCRISQDREGAGLGVERQRADCEALASSLAWTVVRTYVDNDLSAYSGKPRPEYRALLADLSAGLVNAVIVWHTDRLHRSPRELEEYVDICEKHKVITQTVQAGELDLATPSGRAVARTLGAWARYESEHKSERIRRKHEASAHAGLWRGGARPFGWQVREGGKAVLDRSEARVVREACKAILAGDSLGSIVAYLNARRITTSTGRPWNYTSLRQVVTRPRNAGLSELRGEIVGTSTWPAILTEDTWRAVCAFLNDPGRRRSRSNTVRWLMAGLARCGGVLDDGHECGARLKSSNAQSGSPGARVARTVYRCPVRGRGHVGRTAEQIDDLVSRMVVARLSQPDALSLLTPVSSGQDSESLRVEAVALRQRLGEAADQFADGGITDAQLRRITSRVQDRLAEVELALSRSSSCAALADFAAGRDPRRVWDLLSIERRRAVIEALVTVTVLPLGRGNRGFDPESVRFDWHTHAGTPVTPAAGRRTKPAGTRGRP